MTMALAAAAIRTRALADTGSGGLFYASGPLLKSFTFEYAPATNSATPLTDIMPYVVFNFPAWEEDPTFNTDVQSVVCQFHLFLPRESGANAASAILARIYGDGIAQTNRTPTYGFHRHALSLGDTDVTAPWYASPMRRTSRNTAHERDVYHYIDSYDFNVYRVKL